MSRRDNKHTHTRSGKDGFYIFRAWKLDPKTGEKMWAKDHGLRAWRIWVPYDRPRPGKTA